MCWSVSFADEHAFCFLKKWTEINSYLFLIIVIGAKYKLILKCFLFTFSLNADFYQTLFQFLLQLSVSCKKQTKENIFFMLNLNTSKLSFSVWDLSILQDRYDQDTPKCSFVALHNLFLLRLHFHSFLRTGCSWKYLLLKFYKGSSMLAVLSKCYIVNADTVILRIIPHQMLGHS